MKTPACSLIALCLVLCAPAAVQSVSFPAAGRGAGVPISCAAATVQGASSRAAAEDTLSSPTPAAYAIRFYQSYISDLRYGHCRFEPSCSQYALEAIDEYGFVKGSALAADRLMRCNGGAGEWYAKSPEGELLDSPRGSELPCRRPRVPEWLLPPLTGTIPLPESPTRVSGSSDSSHALVSAFWSSASFADDLAARGDCSRAETEYERIAFYGASSPIKYWAAMMAGRCYFRSGAWIDASSRFQRAAEESSTKEEGDIASFMRASARFNAGDHGESERILRSLDSDAGGANRAGILRAVCGMAGGAWEMSAARLSRMAEESPDSLCRERLSLLALDARGGSELPDRNPHVALVLSTMVPGSGQFYAGRTRDGLRHFVFDGLLILSIVQLFRSEQYAAGYLLAGFTLPFYAGNIVGAKRAAERFNACTRLEYVAESLARTDAVGTAEQR